MYPDEFQIDIDYEPRLNDDAWLKQYDIIHYHRTLGDYSQMPELVAKLDSLGIVSVMDLDDHWSPGPHHPAYLIIKTNKIDKLIINNLKCAKNIITTTPLFRDEIAKINPNVFVVPNAIDPNESQFVPKLQPSEKLRIGWLGGSSHLKDLELLKGVVGRLKANGLLDKAQFVLCGFDLRGTMTIINEETKQQTQRPIKPNESVWYQFEKIFTDDYSVVSPEYKEFLLKFSPEEYPNVENEPYRRVWTKPISTYATNYNLFDVSLAPLEDNTFNKAKSQLKVIEAAFHKKALIAQDFGPYQLDLVNYNQYGGEVNSEGNAILINSNKNHKDWFKSIKEVITNPRLVKLLSDNLHESIKDKYSMESVTKQRRNLYRSLLQNK